MTYTIYLSEKDMTALKENGYVEWGIFEIRIKDKKREGIE